MNWFDIPEPTDLISLAGQARREKAALNEMFDRYFTVRWKQTLDLTFASRSVRSGGADRTAPASRQYALATTVGPVV